jgi:hypothetical protein
MKPEPEFDLFRVDPSWYEKYWLAPEPVKSPTWAMRLLGLLAIFRRSQQRVDVTPALQARQVPSGFARDMDAGNLGDRLSEQGNVSHS